MKGSIAAIGVLNTINIVLRSPFFYRDIHKSGVNDPNTLMPGRDAGKYKDEIKEHITYGEMVGLVYDTLNADTRSINYAKCQIGEIDQLNQVVSAVFPDYDVISMLKSSSESFITDKDSDDVFMGFIALNKKKKDLAIVFRGTILMTEWTEDARTVGNIWTKEMDKENEVKNFNIWKSYWLAQFGAGEKIVLHRGFQRMYESCKDAGTELGVKQEREPDSPQARCREALKNTLDIIDTVTITGHSLGAALSVVCGLDMAQQIEVLTKRPVKTRCVSFACHKVGGAAMAKEFKRLNIAHYHYLNRGDIVPCIMPGGFDHEPTIIQRRYDPEAIGVIDESLLKLVSYNLFLFSS